MDKIIKHKIIILILTSLMIIALLAFFFWFNKLRQENRQLIDFVPTNTWQYFEIDFDNNDLKQLLEDRSDIKKVLDSFLINKGLPTNIWKSNCKITKLGLAQVKVIENEKEKNIQVWLIKSPKDIKLLETLDLKNYYLIYLSEDIVALTNSQPIAIKMKNNKNNYSLNLLQHSHNNMAEGYIELPTYFNGINLSEQQKIIEEFVNFKDKLRWQINIDDKGEITIEFNLSINNNFLKQKLLSAGNKSFIIPANTIVVRNFNGEYIFKILEKKLADQFAENKNLFKQLLQDKYQVDFERLYTLFKQPFSVVIQPKNEQLNWYDFLINTKKQNYFYGLVWQGDINFIQNDNIVDLEKFVQNYLAFKFPVARKKILPDGTSGTELIADSTQMIWQSENLKNGVEVHYLLFKNYEYAYAKMVDKFIFTNSREMLINILQAEKRKEVDSFYNIFISPALIKNLRETNLLKIFLGGEIKGNNLKMKAKLL